MVVKCRCGEFIYLTYMDDKEYWSSLSEHYGKDVAKVMKDQMQPTIFEKGKPVICRHCKHAVKITTDNIVSFRSGEFKRLGIFLTYYCNKCRHIIECLPMKTMTSSKEVKYEGLACPICKGTRSISGEYIPDYLGGFDNIGLSDSAKAAKSLFYFAKSLLTYCSNQVKSFDQGLCSSIDNLIEILANKSLTEKGELNLGKVRNNWQDIAKSYEALRDKANKLGIIPADLALRTMAEWDQIVGEIKQTEKEIPKSAFPERRAEASQSADKLTFISRLKKLFGREE